MGIVRLGFPEKYGDYIKKEFGADSFIETGTFKGGTSLWASGKFQKVYTIEGSKYYYNLTKPKLDGKNIKMYYGESKKCLRKIQKEVGESVAIYWLDAHWCGPNTYGKSSECPLLDELKIVTRNKNSFIFIDDARLFLCPPPLPHNYNDWPGINEIVGSVNKTHQTIVVDDVIICYPIKTRKDLLLFTRNYIELSNKRLNLVERLLQIVR